MPNEQLTNKLAEIRKFWNQPTFDINKLFHGSSTTGINSARIDIDLLQYQLQQTREEAEHWHKKWAEDKDLLNSSLSELEHVKAELIDKHSELELVKEELFYEKRSNEENHEKYVEQYHANESLRTELSAKDKVLEWYGNEKNYYFGRPIDLIKGSKARSILSQYEVKHETSK